MSSKSFNSSRHVELKSFDASKPIRKVDVSGHSGEQMIARNFIEQFGFASYPLEGAKGMAIMPDGYAEKAVVVGLDSEQHKPTLSEGEAVLYDANGNKFHLKDGVVEITVIGTLNLNVTGAVNVVADTITATASSNCSVTAPTVNLNGNISSLGGNFSVGTGGKPIARVGDTVTVGMVTGTITSGSSIATCA